MVSTESGAETGMCDVAVVVQFVYWWSGKRGNARVLGRGLKLVDGNDNEWELNQFKYLGLAIAANGGVEADVRHRVNEGCKVLECIERSNEE